jgi:hypothetical protein
MLVGAPVTPVARVEARCKGRVRLRAGRAPPQGAAAQAPLRLPTPLRVITFNGGWNLLVGGATPGIFRLTASRVRVAYTPSSDVLVADLFDDGRYDIALATIGNFVAYQEGQADAKVADPGDLFSFMGGDGGFLSVVSVPSVTTFAELKGRTLGGRDEQRSPSAARAAARNSVSETEVTFVRAGGTPTSLPRSRRRQA